MTDGVDANKSRRLGRGLGALIGTPSSIMPGSFGVPSERTADGIGVQSTVEFREIPLALIAANPYQPRRDFDDQELSELENSLRTNGLLQPITVAAKGTGFELIAGERRVRAARRLGWSSIAAVIREIDQTEHLVLALVENLQRENLNAIDEAEGYQQLIAEFAFTQTQVANAVGKERSTVANALRLLGLPTEVKQLVRTGQLASGHARALLSLPPDSSVIDVAKEVVDRGMTVRDVERLAQRGKEGKRMLAPRRSPASGAAPVKAIQDRLRRFLQTDVQVIADDKARGEVRIRFYSAEDLDRLLGLIVSAPEEGSSTERQIQAEG